MVEHGGPPPPTHKEREWGNKEVNYPSQDSRVPNSMIKQLEILISSTVKLILCPIPRPFVTFRNLLVVHGGALLTPVNAEDG